MLPPDFRWQSILGSGSARDDHALAVKHHQVARLDQRVDGSWIATLHYPDGRSVSRACTSYDTGRAGCEAWATRHQDVLRTWGHMREVEWVARQCWRGNDAALARRRLDALSLPVLDHVPPRDAAPGEPPARGVQPSRT